MTVKMRGRRKVKRVTGQTPDRTYLRRSSRVAIDTRDPKPQQPVLVSTPPLTVTTTNLNRDACEPLAVGARLSSRMGAQPVKVIRKAEAWMIPHGYRDWALDLHSDHDHHG